jgi:spermidine/putrescine transport system substrate-binding protein
MKKALPFVLLLAVVLAAAAFFLTQRNKTAEVLNLYGWAEYFPEAVLEGFTKKTGIKINYEIFSTNEEMIEKLKAGGKYDVVQPSEYVVASMVGDKMLAPLDMAHLPNFKNVAREFRAPSFDPKNIHTVPYLSGSIGILVDTEKVREPIRSFADVFSGKYAGRIVCLDDSRELMGCVLSSQGRSINEVSKKSLAEVKAVLAGWLPQVAVFDSDSPKDAFREGKADIGVVWSGEAAILCRESRKYVYVLPKAGAHRYVDSMAIPVGAPHKDAAHAFINYILRPDVSKLISDKFPYTNPNAEARKFLTAAQLNNPASFPAPSKMDSFTDIGNLQSEIDDVWKAVKPAGRDKAEADEKAEDKADDKKPAGTAS